ncbi:hypothetical protein [Pseudooceanicola sp. HF7]|uniref:hypothetical protein n=1 Tax=Pseudooceanicola sp. HF7 TaxID=2721560 RepID=UPI00143200EB|nr:hypothetical protein [Pseudooceanicola sp. HF7]NIZ10175.1 hypothetical protein [Pseudooceanicola sp. HF7]
MEWFDYEIDVHGAVLIPARDRLGTASLSEAEIDSQIVELKKDLDRVAEAMKSAVRKQQAQPPV